MYSYNNFTTFVIIFLQGNATLVNNQRIIKVRGYH